jgi:hypothetical protein
MVASKDKQMLLDCPPSVRLHASKFHDLGPLFSFISNEACKLGGWTDQRTGAHIDKPSLNLWIAKSCINFSV